ncbi:1-phosphofructokinase family hexose kinase [Maribacter sp. MAR_2009_72]|uniref:1-phosphofructokinase family hexose kinase n=1 Tax=Maribacter sp. MAR_2009_72 TaxID=1250050 RepID=UPI00119B8B64|nr:1-phosphofructokinase family hexose kinase [Maribacter sp. MAR_2009_72]TVZ14841.1 6-phosphofructokinase 2 [Maribacter sp. MAR_2009_72]
MNRIITLTVNPAVDKSTTVNGIVPDNKLRCGTPVYEPGGGGINVSRVIQELGGTSLCMYLSGGPTGIHLQEQLTDLQIDQQIIPISGWVRENLAVTDTKNNAQYRFGMPGPIVQKTEWQRTLKQLDTVLEEDDFLVASGSLCPGMPLDFFAQVAKITTKNKAKYILDTSGEALIKGAKEGVYLLKPNLGELATLCGIEAITYTELEAVAKHFLKNNTCKVLVISMGPKGAMVVANDMAFHIKSPVVLQKSTIGAGDSMVAGMVLALSKNKSIKEMGIYGVACGTAATMTEGSQLCKKNDVDELNSWILENS